MNLVFLSGPHGSGKTTLVKKLLEAIPDAIFPDLETKCIKFDTDPRQRLALKIAERSLENYEYLTIARKNPEKLVFGNRCIYDHYAYSRAYYDRGWILEFEMRRYNECADLCFPKELGSPYAIVLNPRYEIVKLHLEARWKHNIRKWNEKDPDYLRATCYAYKTFGLKPYKDKILYIDKEASNPGVIDEIKDWLILKELIPTKKETVRPQLQQAI
jgi:thymidylate kinase